MTDAARPVRALLATMDLPPTRGGIQTMVRELCARASGIELRVIGPADGGARDHAGARDADAALGVPVARVPRRAGLWGTVPAVAFAVRRTIKTWRPDVVLAMHVLAAPGALRARVPVVVFTHGGEFRSRRIARVARLVLPRADRVVANSRFTRSAAVALGADPMRTAVQLVGAPDPVEVPAAEIEDTRGRVGGRYVLCVARLEPHKGIDRLVRALPDLPEDVRLVVVGDGPERAPLEALARDRGVAGRLRMTGSVPTSELSRYFASADAFALLSRETATGVEGGGIVILEACAYGLPVVAAATGGIPETVRDGDTGLLVDPDDAPAVARALRRVLDDRGLAARLGENARAMATGERSWAKFTERMEAMLTEAAGRAR